MQIPFVFHCSRLSQDISGLNELADKLICYSDKIRILQEYNLR